MSSFEVKVYRLEILPHPDADNIELAKVGDYVSIVRKGDFKTGDTGVYIPEQALVPLALLKEMGLEGKLSGTDKNRVKAIKLRKVLSQGLIYSNKNWKEGQDVKEELSITKWEPIIPQHMSGKAVGLDQSITINYDIENIKKYNQIFLDGEIVIITEKIHGTFVQIGCVPQRLFRPYLYLGTYTVSSKGLGGRGILLDYTDQTNIYAKIATDKHYNLGCKMHVIRAEYKDIVEDNPIYICGEIFGPGVQDGFGYGVSNNDISFRAFDIAYGERSNLKFLDAKLFHKIVKDYEIPSVPILYEGPFNKEVLQQYTNGMETISSKDLHMREGSVTKPIQERYDSEAGRVILKNISEAYLLRKGGTEYQ